MEDKLYIKLLKLLDQHNMHEDYNVSPFMFDNFERPPYLGNGQFGWVNEVDLIAKDFLIRLKLKGYIDFNQQELSNKIAFSYFDTHSGTIEPSRMDQWFDDVEFPIRLTLEGLSHLDSIRIIQSNLEVNQASIRNFKSQIWFSLGTLGVAIVGAILSYIAFSYTKTNDNGIETLNKRLIMLERQLKERPPVQTIPQGPSSSPVQKKLHRH